MDKKMIKTLIKLVKKHKQGFTYEFYQYKNTIRYKKITSKDKRYIVSIKTLITIKKEADKTIITYYDDNIKLLNTKNILIIGGWLDEETKTYYVEINKAFQDLKLALIIAKMFNQKCIYDIQKERVIYV